MLYKKLPKNHDYQYLLGEFVPVIFKLTVTVYIQSNKAH